MPRLTNNAFEAYMIEALRESKMACVGPSFFLDYFRRKYGLKYRDARHFNKKCINVAIESSIIGCNFVGNTHVYYLKPVFEMGWEKFSETLNQLIE